MRKISVYALIIFILGGACATYQHKIYQSRESLKSGQPKIAIEKLRPLADQPGDDQLVYILDLATALQAAGDYKESNKYFHMADRLADQLDYHSVSKVALAALGSEEMIQYKGESFEKVFINIFSALNYLSLGQLDEALVEVKRVNEKINKFRLDGRKNYELNPFAHYLSGLIWEAERKYDDAYISFESAYKLDSSQYFIGKDLIRSAKLSQRDESYKKWKKEFSAISEDPNWYDKTYGEIVFIFLVGWGPQKEFSRSDMRFPELVPSRALTQDVYVNFQGDNGNTNPVVSDIYNIEKVSIKTLTDDYSAMALRKMGGIVAKEVMADQLRQKNEALGNIALLVMQISDRADLRQWSTLPKKIQMARLRLKPGSYNFRMGGYGYNKSLSADLKEDVQITVEANKKTFYIWRPLH